MYQEDAEARDHRREIVAAEDDRRKGVYGPTSRGRWVGFYVATDPDPENPNPHHWKVTGGPYDSAEEANAAAEREEEELKTELELDDVSDYFRWLIIDCSHVEEVCRRAQS